MSATTTETRHSHEATASSKGTPEAVGAAAMGASDVVIGPSWQTDPEAIEALGGIITSLSERCLKAKW